MNKRKTPKHMSDTHHDRVVGGLRKLDVNAQIFV